MAGEEHGEVSPDEAFSVLSDETRFAILRELRDADDHALSFSDLRDRVGVADSGQFNYHLGKLTGPFVRKTDEGYAIRYAGSRVIGAVLSGVYTRTETLDPVPVEGECFECGEQLQAAYENERASVECSECDTEITNYGVPPGLLDGYDRDALPGAVDGWLKALLLQTTLGFCPLCLGRMQPSIGTDRDLDVDYLGATFQCERCGERLDSTIGAAVLFSPSVIAFHHRRGVDVWSTPIWKLDWLYTDVAELVSDDPPRARAEIRMDGHELVLTVDEDLTVVDAASPDTGGNAAVPDQ